jgi:beta-glucanase (GH16 family)
MKSVTRRHFVQTVAASVAAVETASSFRSSSFDHPQLEPAAVIYPGGFLWGCTVRSEDYMIRSDKCIKAKCRSSLVLRGFFAIALCCLALRTAGAQTWKLAWSDEFNGTANSRINPQNWQFETGILKVNNEVEYYCAPGSNTSPCNPKTPNAYIDGNGHLVIQALRINSSTDPFSASWTSARLNTGNNLRSFHYGRIESRISLPIGPGLFPAFWALGTNMDSVGWPMSGEIDFMENVPASRHLGPSAIRSTILGGVSGSRCYCGRQSIGKTYTFPGNDPNGADVTTFHTYGAIWSTDMIQFYVDDPANVFFVATPSDIPPGFTWQFNHPFYLILNLAVGGTGSWPGPPGDATPSPAVMKVDYVRVYTPSPIAGPSIAGSAISVIPGQSGRSELSLKSVAGSGRVYLTCRTNAPKTVCAVNSNDALNAHTVDFTRGSTATASVTVTTTASASAADSGTTGTGGSGTPPGDYSVTVSAFTVSNSSGNPDSTISIALMVN